MGCNTWISFLVQRVKAVTHEAFYFYYFRTIAKYRPFPCKSKAEKLAFVTSRMEFCSYILSGPCKKTGQKGASFQKCSSTDPNENKRTINGQAPAYPSQCLLMFQNVILDP